MNNFIITSLKPYHVRVSGGGFLSRPVAEVSFEGDPVRMLEGGDFAFYKDLQFMLNAAYQLGFSSGCVQGELNESLQNLQKRIDEIVAKNEAAKST